MTSRNAHTTRVTRANQCTVMGVVVLVSAAIHPMATHAQSLGTRRWERPWTVVTADVVVPFGVTVMTDVFVSNTWSVGATFRSSRLGQAYGASFRYWPVLAHTGERQHQFMLGIGGDLQLDHSPASAGLSLYTGPAIDLRYLGRAMPALGFVLGTRLGAGVILQRSDALGVPRSALSHLGVEFMLYVGLSFGVHAR